MATSPARIVNVASDAQTFGPMEPDDYMSTQVYKPLNVYGRSKLANILFTDELAARLEGLNKTFGTTILVSADVYLRVEELFKFRALDAVVAKGMTKETCIFELLGAST